jgi:excisionase family DNA binding protein
MTEKLLEVSIVAKRLSLHDETVRRMFRNGVLQGTKTGPSKTRIRIYESSVAKHIETQQNAH